MSAYLKIDGRDNVAIALENLSAGTTIKERDLSIRLRESIVRGHKFALVPIEKGSEIIKYGYSIGHASSAIEQGDHVHTHNVKTNLGDQLEYSYNREERIDPQVQCDDTFLGYKRSHGKVGIRNEVWIINTVGCVNKTAELIAREGNRLYGARCDGIFTFPHPFGCSQLGEDHNNTARVLKNLVMHPNAGAVLVLGLGCENNNIKEFKKLLGPVDEKRIAFLETQSVEDEVQAALEILSELTEVTAQDTRTPCPASELVIGLKCGASDGLSGITANPLLGRLSNKLIDSGGSSLLTEVPEMFGAETMLMDRAADEKVFQDIVSLINDFKAYFRSYGQNVHENPSPGNKDGGITTLEDKSLGCTQKGGDRLVRDVLAYGETVKSKGLSLLNGPGNDMVAVTNLASSGAHMVLFTTGRGTPLGGPVPTVKISTNSELAKKKKNWIDFNAGVLTEGKSMEDLSSRFWTYILKVASGELTLNEKNHYREISIFKEGVTL